MKKDILIQCLQVVCWFSLGSLGFAADQTASNAEAAGRPVTVSDSIRMTMLGDPHYFAGGPALDVAKFSPDGKEIVVLLRKGNIEHNTNEFSLLLWRTDRVFHSPTPEILLTMTSSSNRDAIANPKWLDDNETITFLGERPGELRQLYTLNVRTHILKKITSHPTNLISYSMTSDGEKVAYVAEPPEESIWDEKARREGVIVSSQWIGDLFAGQKGTATNIDNRLFLLTSAEGSHRLNIPDRISWLGDSLAPSLSPDGKYIVLMADVTVFPEVWKEYSDRQVASMAGQKLLPGEYSPCRRYVLINTETAESHFLLDAPVADPSSRVAWSVDNQSVVITQTYLPFDDTEGGERKERGFKYFAAEVRISTGGYAKVSNEDLRRLRLLSWDKKRNRLIFEANTTSENPRPGSKVIFWKNGEKWEKATITAPENSAPKIVLEEDLNTPPRMFAVNPATDNKSLLLDLNPDFSQLTFGRVENIRFKSSDRRERNGGLYYPVNYIAGKRYPLVIQTHGWAPGVHRFLMNGFSTTSNAAQPLAGRGIMVLQVDDMDRNADGTPEEAPEAAGVYEGAIDYLDERALIDRNRVGIIGFSRTCYYVKYALTHSKYHFVAASVADGIDGGYVDYQLLATSPVRAKDQEGVNGGYPFGAGLKLWIEHSPGFNVDKVHTPLLITALRPNSLLGEWEWFASLARLGKPVEMVYLQDGAHELEKPWDRMISQGRNVDWFVFWLKGEEDPDPVKKEQYARWSMLRASQSETAKVNLSNK